MSACSHLRIYTNDYADDLAAVIEALDLRNVPLVGYSHGRW